MRLFFAVEIPESPVFNELNNKMGQISGELKTVKPGKQHITLKFLGDPGCEIENVIEAPLDLESKIRKFELRIERAGAFPNWKRPSVLWLGLEPSECVRDLAIELDKVLHEKLGIEMEKRDFRAHITIARIRNMGPIRIPGARTELEKAARMLASEGYRINVDRFHLLKSTLTPQGPVYSKRATYELKGQ